MNDYEAALTVFKAELVSNNETAVYYERQIEHYKMLNETRSVGTYRSYAENLAPRIAALITVVNLLKETIAGLVP